VFVLSIYILLYNHNHDIQVVNNIYYILYYLIGWIAAITKDNRLPLKIKFFWRLNPNKKKTRTMRVLNVLFALIKFQDFRGS